MKRSPLTQLAQTTLLGLCLALPSPQLTAADPTGLVDFGKLTSPAGGKFIEVNLSSTLLGLAAKFAEKEEPDAAELIRSIQSVRANVLDLQEDNRSEVLAKITAIRSDLTSKGWERVVTVQEKNQDVGVFIKMRGQESVEGIVVTVVNNNKEAVLVNIVGDVRPEKLSALGERLNIAPLKKIIPAPSK